MVEVIVVVCFEVLLEVSVGELVQWLGNFMLVAEKNTTTHMWKDQIPQQGLLLAQCFFLVC